MGDVQRLLNMLSIRHWVEHREKITEGERRNVAICHQRQFNRTMIVRGEDCHRNASERSSHPVRLDRRVHCSRIAAAGAHRTCIRRKALHLQRSLVSHRYRSGNHLKRPFHTCVLNSLSYRWLVSLSAHNSVWRNGLQSCERHDRCLWEHSFDTDRILPPNCLASTQRWVSKLKR